LPKQYTHNITKKNFMGGTILPGIRLMPKSLYERTAGIKEGEGSWAEFPTNTADAVTSGVLAATAGAIAGMIHNLQQIQHESVQLLLSGGNSPLLLPRLSALGFDPHYERDLVLQGIALMSAAEEK
jgi:type III pantothenate kinase